MSRVSPTEPVQSIKEFKRYTDIPGWFDFEPVYDLAPCDGTVVEVGAWLGRSTVYLANRVHVLYAVDTWRGSKGADPKSDAMHMAILNQHDGDVFGEFMKNMEECGVCHKIRPLRMMSAMAAKCFPTCSIDFIFLDAAHDYQSVWNDIVNWYPKIKYGGVLAGHDYDDHWPGVRRAVDEYFGTSFKLIKNSWVHRKP